LVVRSIGGSSLSSSVLFGHGRLTASRFDVTVEWTMRTPKAFAILTVETMLSSRRSPSNDRTPANWEGW
jgi:hypothetical protein